MSGTTSDSMGQINTSKPLLSPSSSTLWLLQQLQLHLTGDRYRERSFVGQLVLAKLAAVASGLAWLGLAWPGQLATCFHAIKIKFTTAAVSCLCCRCCCCCCYCCCSYCMGYLLHMHRVANCCYPSLLPPPHRNLSSNCRHSANNLTLMHVEFNCSMYEYIRSSLSLPRRSPHNATLGTHGIW